MTDKDDYIENELIDEDDYSDPVVSEIDTESDIEYPIEDVQHGELEIKSSISGDKIFMVKSSDQYQNNSLKEAMKKNKNLTKDELDKQIEEVFNDLNSSYDINKKQNDDLKYLANFFKHSDITIKNKFLEELQENGKPIKGDSDELKNFMDMLKEDVEQDLEQSKSNISAKNKIPQNIKHNSKIYSKSKLDFITTDGVVNDGSHIIRADLLKLVHDCTYCLKRYNSDMIVDIHDNEKMCWHCFFWMNYDISLRNNCDGTMGLTIADYVLKCSDEHKMDKCTRRTDNGGCFLCEYKLEMPILSIKDGYKLGNIEPDNINIKSNDGMSDYEDEDRIVIYI
jgi:hypothetical protein